MEFSDFDYDTESDSEFDVEDDDSDVSRTFVHPSLDDNTPKEICNSIKAIQNRQFGFVQGIHQKSSCMLTSANSYLFKNYISNSLKFVRTLKITSTLEEHSQHVHSIDFDFSGDFICSSGADCKVAIWDWKQSNLKYIYNSGHNKRVRRCKWTSDNQNIVTCSDDSNIRLANVNYRSITSSKVICNKHLGSVYDFTFCEPNVILSCGDDGSVYQTDIRYSDPTQLLSIKKKQQPLSLLSIDCNMEIAPHQFATSGNGSYVRVYDRRFLCFDKQIPCVTFIPFNLKNDPDQNKKLLVGSVKYSNDGSKILASYSNSDLYIFDVQSNQFDIKLNGHAFVHQPQIGQKGCWFSDKYVLYCSNDSIYGWNIDSKQMVFRARAEITDDILGIVTHPTEPYVATCGTSCKVHIWTQMYNESDQYFNYNHIRKIISKNVRNRKMYENYNDYLNNRDEFKVYSSISNLFDNFSSYNNDDFFDASSNDEFFFGYDYEEDQDDFFDDYSSDDNESDDDDDDDDDGSIRDLECITS